jgi:hypothetical protein
MTFAPRWIIGQLELTNYPFSVLRGTADAGAPQNVASIIDSDLLDGDVSQVTHVSNRTYSLSVLIEETDGEALARAEALLIGECSKWFNELQVVPGDGFGATCCFQVFEPQVTFVPDEDFEWAGFRRYDIAWPCLPFALAETTETFGVATPPAPDPAVLVNAGTTLVGVSYPSVPDYNRGSVALSGSGDLRLSRVVSNGYSGNQWGLVFDLTGKTTGAADHTTYFYVDARPETTSLYNSPLVLWLSASGNPLDRQWPIVSLALGNGYVRSVFVIDQDVTSATIFGFFPSAAAGGYANVLIDQVWLDGDLPRPSGSEQVLTAQIKGSARATGSLLVSHSAAGLGRTIVYSAPELASGYAPPIRRFQTVSGATLLRSGVPAFFSTTWTKLNSTTFEIPASALPSGPFVLMGNLYAASAFNGSVPWTAQVKINGALVGPVQTASAPVSIASTKDGLFSLGGQVLPPMEVGAGASVVITFGTISTDLYFDDLFLLYQGDDTSLTIVECGSGTPALGSVHNSLWLESPTVANGGLPKILVGVDQDRVSAISGYPFASSWEVPPMPPGPLSVFIATAAVTAPDLSGTYRPAFHTHVAAGAV